MTLPTNTCCGLASRWLKVFTLALGCCVQAKAQGQPVPTTPREIQLDNVDVAPPVGDVSGWLLLDKDIQLELGGAVQNLYNFKFDKAEKQFRSLRRRYPQHPMPYFLLGLSTWWKMMPRNVADTRYDKIFLAYLDTAETKAETLYKGDKHNYEACFFLSAAYGFEARLQSERHNWRKATVNSRRALDYLEKSREANGLSIEFSFGEGLFNYYAVWIADEFPWLRPVLLFFPKGDRARGIAQLRQVGQSAFYTGTEAKFFLGQILNGTRENQPEAAYQIARELATTYPDNARFQYDYVKLCFQLGHWPECDTECATILAKYNAGQFGYEAYTGRVAAYILGYANEHRNKPDQAKDFYQRCIVFSEQCDMTTQGYYLFSQAGLARLAVKEHDLPTARRYYTALLEQDDKHHESYREAKTWLRANPEKRN
jgi:hypothetical protein